MPHDLDAGTFEGAGASGKDHMRRKPMRHCARCDTDIGRDGGKKYCSGCSDIVREDQRRAQKARQRARRIGA